MRNRNGNAEWRSFRIPRFRSLFLILLQTLNRAQACRVLARRNMREIQKALPVMALPLLSGCRVIASDLRGGGVGVIGILIVVSIVATVAALVRRSAG
jgi:hypothetical protein